MIPATSRTTRLPRPRIDPVRRSHSFAGHCSGLALTREVALAARRPGDHPVKSVGCRRHGASCSRHAQSQEQYDWQRSRGVSCRATAISKVVARDRRNGGCSRTSTATGSARYSANRGSHRGAGGVTSPEGRVEQCNSAGRGNVHTDPHPVARAAALRSGAIRPA